MEIWKFNLMAHSAIQKIQMPKAARILSCQTQGEVLRVWAEVDPEEKREIRNFRVLTTGQAIQKENHWVYIGTFQLLHGSFVGHLYEL